MLQIYFVCSELKNAHRKSSSGLISGKGDEVAVFGQLRWNGVLIASKAPISEVHKGLPAVDEGQSRLIACETWD